MNLIFWDEEDETPETEPTVEETTHSDDWGNDTEPTEENDEQENTHA